MNTTYNVLFVGDIVGNAGMNAVRLYLPGLIAEHSADIVVVNGENIYQGKGLSDKDAKELFALGAHVITTGNHVWENWQSRPLLEANPNVLRPHNYPPGNPGSGIVVRSLPDGTLFCVMQVQGRTFMQSIDCPFRCLDALVAALDPRVKIVIVDFHADASAEKMAMGWHADGRVSAVLGTHTHCQTADAQILPGGTGYISDVGMTGPYDSILGMRKDVGLNRLILQTAHKYEPADKDQRLCAVVLTVDAADGSCLAIQNIMTPEPPRLRRKGT